MFPSRSFRLEVQQVQQSCLFKLSWGTGQQLSATLPYPESLAQLYQQWQRVYHRFYHDFPAATVRGQAEFSGTLARSTVDWRARLVEAEASLLYAFQHWLRGAELYEIQATITQAARYWAGEKTSLLADRSVEVFLTCHPLELERFPWEAWEIGAAAGLARTIRIARTPLDIRHEPVKPQHRRPRILAILGDDTGLDFKIDRQAVEKKLKPIAYLEFVGWQVTTNDIGELKTQIIQALTAELGWDAILFFGHSNETELTGGELAIAPNTSVSIDELTPQLLKAKERGLLFALFNSCNGLKIARSLVNLGLSQVAVMREPIHNTVAQQFLIHFLQALATKCDVHEAMLAATQEMQKSSFTFPSAYLIPSLFRHPEAPLFRLHPWGVKQWLRQLLPTRTEAIALGAILLLSLIPDVQSLLLDARLGVQAVYRDFTHQIPPSPSPPVLLVQVDRDSLMRAKVDAHKINPIDRRYLASLIQQIAQLKAKVIAIDYFFPEPTNEDSALATAVQAAAKKGSRFIFAKDETLPENKAKWLDDRWSLSADILLHSGYVELPSSQNACPQDCPFAYLMALVYTLDRQSSSPTLLPNQTGLTAQVSNLLQSESATSDVAFWKSERLQLSNNFGQVWLQPIIDFSIPPDRVYESVPAWKLMDEKTKFSQIDRQIVLIAPGGYEQADDNFSVPLAISYWRRESAKNSSELPKTSFQGGANPKSKIQNPKSSDVFTGGEIHSYAIHHLLSQHLVIPIPDLWLVGIAALLGKGIALAPGVAERRRKWTIALVGTTLAYGAIGLQVYISGAVLLPWFLPSGIFWSYILLNRKRSSSQNSPASS
jgi:hypothetical protein